MGEFTHPKLAICRSLKRELVRAQEEIKRIQSVPLVIGQFMEAIDQKYCCTNQPPRGVKADGVNSTGIVQSSTGSNYVVRILSTLDREKLKPSSSVALHRHSNSLVDILPPEADSSIAMLGAHEKPDVTYADVGGLDMQKQEIREAVELPLTHFDLYKQIGQSIKWHGVCALFIMPRYRSSAWRSPLRPPRDWQNDACESSSKQHYR